MDELEVDPALFVTCRLCIENTGVFQVLPIIQEQIKYCFDIDVASYDGLPQLICKTCKTILNDYFGIKKSFVEKQNALKARIVSKNKPPEEQQNYSSGSENIFQHENNKSKKKKRKFKLPSDSSDENGEEFCSDKVVVKVVNQPKKPKRSTSSWEKNFVKAFVCTICNKHCKNRGRLTKHLHKHRKLIAKYGSILNKTVTVDLNRIDNAPNITDSTSNVVFDPNMVISNEGKSNYFILYSQKNTANPKDGNQSRHNNDKDCLSGEDLVIRGGSKRKRRLLSNDTVVLGDNSDSSDNENKATPRNNETECINIDDTSDSEIELKSADETIQPRVSDYKTIQDLISMCQTNYLRKQEGYNDLPLSATTETQLKRKILNVGRKTINKKSLSCTGILRFLEHKHLEIKWNQMLPPSNKDSFVVLFPKSRGKEFVSDNLGWKDVPGEPENKSDLNSDTSHMIIQADDKYLTNDNIHSQTVTENAILYLNKSDTCDSKSKMLLNINPVANPKQLLKLKTDKPENFGKKYNPPNLYLTVDNGKFSTPNVYSTVSKNHTDNFCMPVITSTTSLAVPPDSEKIEENIIIKAPLTNQIQAPRIKVKPASELMSERVLKTLTQQEAMNAHTSVGVWTPNPDAIPNSIENQNPSPSVLQKKCNGHPIPTSMVTESKTRTIVLDTVEFPNTRTDSPFKYLQQLLFVHNLILIDSTEKVNGLDICLIKFKIQFKQEFIENPLVLNLSILCSGNKFFIGVKSGLHGDNIDICALDAHWQWRVLTQICQESVVNKAIKISENINVTLMENTKRFFLLIKSIKVKDVPIQ